MEQFRAWRATVLAQVRFWPDRKDIGQELTARYEDHVRDLERLDYPQKLAEQRALDAMGDPGSIGKALDRVHKPWLGWLWTASRILLVVLTITAVCAAWFLDGAVTMYQRIQAENGWEALASQQPCGTALWRSAGGAGVDPSGKQYMAEVKI